MVSRRRWLFGAASSTASAVAYPSIVEPRWLDTTHTRINLGLNDRLRVLHMADLHASFFVPMAHIRHAIDIGLRERPDFVCLTGDYITSSHGFDPDSYVRLLRRLTTAAPTYAVLGNHDGGAWAISRGGFADHRLVEQLLSAAGVIWTLAGARNSTIPVGR